MIPVIVGGGVITAIAKMMGGYNIGDTAAEMQTLAQVIFTIGNNLFAFAVPCLAAFIAYAIADKPGIAPGYAMGVLAGLLKPGFVGGLGGALIAGWFVLQMKKIKVPKALQGIMPIMFIPVLSTLIVGLESPAVHGGVFSVAMTSNPLLFIGLWLLGGCITGLLYSILKRPLAEGAEDEEMENPLI